MWKLLILGLTLGGLQRSATARTYPDDEDDNSKSRYRQTLYNYRPQSALIEDENEYRSYDNSFSPLGAATDAPATRSFPGGNYRSARRPNPQTKRPYYDEDDDYPTGSPTLPDDDDVELENQGPSPAAPYGYNFRSSSRGPPPRPPRRYWDDQSGRERGDPSYSFGYELDDQSRRENSDVFGNVNGDFSFVDDEGTYRKVSYSAGAHKGFVVNQKTPLDPPLPSPPRRLKKPPVILTDPVRPPPGRAPNPSSIGSWTGPTEKQTHDGAGGAGAGIGINVVKGVGSAHPVSPPRPPGNSAHGHGHAHGMVHAGSGSNRHKSGWTPQSRPHMSGGNDGGGSGGKGSVPASPAAEDGPSGPSGPDEAGAAGGSKSWGALGNNQQPTRPRHMRKRKPALVVKVRRPAGSQGSSLPAWMYYRPPNNRPLSEPPAGWQGKKPFAPPPPEPAPTDSAVAGGDHGSGWTDEDENDLADPYPKDKSYSFGYNTGDQTRQEVSDAWGNIRGSYSYVDPAGIQRTVHYTAGHSGFKVLSAQPSILNPVYADAPRVQSIPIPLPVMSHLSQLTAHLPQASAIVYHIHPDNGIGAEWRPWESSRTKSRYHHGGKNKLQQRSHHHHQHQRTRSSRQKTQQNLFHLTHDNDRFFPAFSRITEPGSLEASVSPDIEILPDNFEENEVYLKHLKQQLRRSHKLRKLQQQFQEPIREYTNKNNNKLFPPRSSQNRLGFTTDTLEVNPPPDDLQYSDYDVTTVQTNPSGGRRRHGRKERLRRPTPKNESEVNQDSTVPATAVAAAAAASSESQSVPLMAIEGEPEIQSYQGGYGDKNPLLVISESPPQQRDSKESRTLRNRLQRKTSDDDNIPARLLVASMEKRGFSSASRSMERREPLESKIVTSVTKSESMEVSSAQVSAAAAAEQSKERAYVSPASLIRAKMSSAPPAKVTPISMIPMMDGAGNVMHFPPDTTEPSRSASKESHQNSNSNNMN